MKNRSSSIPMGMVTRKFFCHRCGEQLARTPRTRTLRRGDPDYKKYNRIGRMRMIGDVEVTEFDFRCSACGKIIGYEEQCVIEYIQKQTGGHILSQSEIAAKEAEAKATLKRKRTLTNAIVYAVFIAAVILILYFQSPA